MYRTRILLCAPLALIVVGLSMFPVMQFPGWQWLAAALTIPVVTWGAWPFHRVTLINMRHGSTTMDTLVSLGVTASTLWSLWALVWGGAGEIGMTMDMSWHSLVTGLHTMGNDPHSHAMIYFEGATMITLFLLIGRQIEHRTKGVAKDALTALMEMNAPTALLVTEVDGQPQEHEVPTETIQVGDTLRVRPGDRLPVDGQVIHGNSAIDASAITGESVPVDVSVGDAVIGGTVNTWGSILVQASAIGEDTIMAHIGQMVAQAQASKADVQRLADRISAVFVPSILTLAAMTFLGWILLGGSAQQAMTAAVAVLVVACPCALGLATPTAIMVGSAQAARQGVIIRSAQALEHTRNLTTVVFDKTGTITDGHMSVVAAEILTDQAGEAAQWAAAASVEAASEHPIAQAIVTQAKADNRQPQPVQAFTNHAGQGVSAVLGEDLILVGKPTWLESLGAHSQPALDSFRHHHELSGATVVGMVRVSGGRAALSATTAPAQKASEETSGTQDTHLPAIQLSIQGMTCASCVGRVERKLRKMGGLDASVNLATESALILREHNWQPDDLIATIEAAGYHAQFTGWKETAPQTDSIHAHESADAVANEDAIRTALAGIETTISAFFAVKDAVKDGAAQAIAELKSMGITPILLTGDNQHAADIVAQAVGIDTVYSQVSPAQKCERIKELRLAGQVVAMVGDGVNDAAALAGADLGIAMGTGTDVAQDVADVVLTTSRIDAVAQAVRMSQATLRVIKQNLGWAFGYNVLLVPLAVAGMLNPMLAAAAMSMSSVCVVANSLRLRRLI